MAKLRRVQPRVVLLGRSEAMNAEARRGVADGRVWAAEMAAKRDQEVLLDTIEDLPDSSVLEVDGMIFFLVWRLVLGPAVDEFHARYGDEQSREKYRMDWFRIHYDYLRGFYLGALAVLIRRVAPSKSGAACAENQHEEPAACVPNGNTEEKGTGT